ncbi:outer membrane protein with beta-barrel domain [Dysgonomonas alginatilytica]|uniref:Outer membrane protein with beta-barrel domain n=1 Tax=Dysgonomonas alginatilytica TaxID=1605892 RepID=A0A2V3PUK1_9BACT|nr:porin family protein [Dysgonomonas alginatilytica]PXV67991.1 outer membrane protein with beta-barrel domain [Dysgonomonas alginatilytica]
MIKRTLAVLLLALACIKGYSQDKFVPEWNFGVNFGPTFSTMSFVTTDPADHLGTKMIQQYKGGLSARYITENRLGFIAELNYSLQGYEQKFTEETESKYIQKLAYLQIPFLTHIYFGRKGRVFINLGPQISFLVGEQKIKDLLLSDYGENPIISDQTGESSVTSKVSAQYSLKVQNKFDYGLVAGMGFELRTSAGNFAIEGRYYMGFSDIYSSHKTDPFSRSANRVMSAAITYYIKPF